MYLRSTKTNLQGSISIPASKSHTIRAVAVATMANGKSVLIEPLDSEDAKSSLKAAEEFGATVTHTDKGIEIEGVGSKPKSTASFIDVGNSGTTLRIFTALAALSGNKIKFDGDHSIRQRPMTSLFNSLQSLGASFYTENQKCPFEVMGPITGGKTVVDGISSQFLTAVLFAAPLASDNTEIVVENLHEKPYVEITLDWLRHQNIEFEQKGLDWFKVKGGQSYAPFTRRIPADFSSATFALCAAAITKSEVFITGLDFNDHQGDKEVFNFFEKMGTEIQRTKDGVLVRRKELKGIDIDMNDTPDALPAMAVAACFAKGQTRLLNVKQARLKECDRIKAMTTELTKMGAKVEELPDGMVINESSLKGAKLHGYDDHRMVMALSIAGMMADGETTIDTAESIK
ncbi:MAG: 3-phosphoshikimate 1-carboxyvinyltransferase, partial [Bacteroidales bacterium]|nr:3-phosphoshikimate 1-carboxyvinyltransferase [Bacteroidales bacterium]